MADFGTDVGNTAISASSNVVTKLMSAIMSFFKYLFDSWQKAPERRLTRVKLKDFENEAAKKAFIKKLEGRAGYIRYKDLQKAGIECSTLGIHMTSEEMKAFSARCKRENILFTAVIDKNDLSHDRKIYNILCPVNELEKIKSVIDLLNVEKFIDGVDKRISDIEGKGELTEQDKTDIDCLKKQRDDAIREYNDKLNEEQAACFCEKAVYGKTMRGVSFDDAVDRFTGSSLDKDQNYIICDASDPTKYIKCHSYNDVFRDKQYIKTDYDVYSGSKMIYQTNDGRFEGRPEHYWFSIRAKMKSIGGIGDTVYKFHSMPEYERWAEHFKTQNEAELSGFEYKGTEGRDYSALSERLLKQLNEDGAKYANGVVLDSTTNNAFTLTESMSMETKARIAEAEVIGKQINNYESLMSLETELAIANSTVITTKDGTPEHEAAIAEYNSVNAQYKAALDTEKSLYSERISINGVQAEQECKDSERANDTDISLEQDRPDKNNRALSEYKEEISELRSNDSVKQSAVKDRSVPDKAIPADRGDR